MKITTRSAILVVLLLAAGSAAAGEAEKAAAAPGTKAAKPFRWGGALELWRSEIDIYIYDIEGYNWRGDPINGAATNDTEENAKYSTQRIYTGLQGFVEYEPMSDLTLVGLVRIGLVREIYQGKHGDGSFFVNWGNAPETDVVSFRSTFLVGFGAGATYAFEKFRIGADLGLSTDATGFKNQDWFTQREDGSLWITTFELRGRVGYDFGFIVPRFAIGVFIYDAVGDFDQILAPSGRHDSWEASFANEIAVQFTAGADIPMSEKIFASVDLAFVAELALRVTIGFKM
ncbi:MAG: hypothetical protein ACYS47_09195 [Planctomycetota bacterium]|jgi:hypothetical protein